MAQPRGKIKDWRKGEVEPIPGKTMPNLQIVERDYPNVYQKMTSIGPNIEKRIWWKRRKNSRRKGIMKN